MRRTQPLDQQTTQWSQDLLLGETRPRGGHGALWDNVWCAYITWSLLSRNLFSAILREQLRMEDFFPGDFTKNSSQVSIV